MKPCAHCNATGWVPHGHDARNHGIKPCVACGGFGYIYMISLDDPHSLDVAYAKDRAEDDRGNYR